MKTKKEIQLLKETANSLSKATKLFVKYRKDSNFENYDNAMEILFNTQQEINLNLLNWLRNKD